MKDEDVGRDMKVTSSLTAKLELQLKLTDTDFRPNINQLILKSNWTFMQNLKKFPQGVFFEILQQPESIMPPATLLVQSYLLSSFTVD